jgi:hypothetical protein
MITVTFNPQNPEQVQILAWAMTKLLEASPAEPVEEKEAPAKKPRAQKAAPAAQTPAEPETPPVVESAPALTLVDVRAVLVKLNDAGKGQEVRALIGEMGYANLTAVPEDRYSELLNKAKELM